MATLTYMTRLTTLLCLFSVLTMACKDDDKDSFNPNKVVVGGNNSGPQMGLFVLSEADARRVDEALATDPKSAYGLANELAVKKFAGDRSFCEDAVRMTIGYFGVDGMLDAEALESWKTVETSQLKAKHMSAINKMHEDMIGESNPKRCEKSLEGFAENIRYAASEGLQLRNFGY